MSSGGLPLPCNVLQSGFADVVGQDSLSRDKTYIVTANDQSALNYNEMQGIRSFYFKLNYKLHLIDTKHIYHEKFWQQHCILVLFKMTLPLESVGDESWSLISSMRSYIEVLLHLKRSTNSSSLTDVKGFIRSGSVL